MEGKVLVAWGANSGRPLPRTAAPGCVTRVRPQWTWVMGPPGKSRAPRSFGSCSWDQLLPSSVLGARQAQKPPVPARPACPLTGRKWAGPERRGARQTCPEVAQSGLVWGLLTHASPPPARLPTSSGPEAALGQSGDPGWTGGRARDLSLLLKTPSRAGTLGPGL